MDISLIIILWVIIAIFQAINEKKKTPRPPNFPPRNPEGNIDFEIPTLANDPNSSAEVHEINLEELYNRRKFHAQTEKNFDSPEVKPKIKTATQQKNFPVDLNPASAMNAIVLGEILGKPKSMRH